MIDIYFPHCNLVRKVDAASVLRKLQSSVGVKCKHNESTKQQGIESATALGTLKRLDLSSFPTYRKSGTFTSIIQSSEPHGIIEKQFAERRNMIMNHRASHERLRNSVFSRVQELINTSGVTNDRKSIESTKSMVEAILCEHEQMKVSLMMVVHHNTMKECVFFVCLFIYLFTTLLSL